MIKTFEQFQNERDELSQINEFVDPITIALAAMTVGIAFAEPIASAYRERKMLKMSLEELLNSKNKLEYKLNKENNKRNSNPSKIDKLTQELKSIEFRLKQLDNNINKIEDTISDGEKETKYLLKDLKSNYSPSELRSILKDAKKDANELK